MIEVNSKMRNKTLKENNVVGLFDRFGPNITAEHNCSQKTITSSLMYKPYAE